MDIPNESAGVVLDLTLLRTFLEVVDSGGFALAADALSLTPSAISGHIKRLEVLAGATLLERTTRSFEVTPAGETLYAYARNIVDLEREARARLSGTRLKGRLRIGSSEDFAGAWLAEVLQAFHRGHPEASIELKVGVTADLLRQQARGKLDVVFGKQCARVQDDGELLWEEDLVWAWGEDKPWKPGRQVPLAVFPEPCVYREAAITALGQTKQGWVPAFESGSMAGCLAAALAGFAVAPVARSQLREGLRALSRDDGMPDLPMTRFYAYLRSAEPAVQALVAAVRQTGQRRRFGR
ncbi:LysR family transcriptional regulator [Achromobacter marplatensis]|jgi:DNA-binding transcriptional LysR family regulator|uniref:LysR family transcriptional regulator n=2 Tax=Pseudomonadota TaxID=1224 RepID=A0AA43B1A3_9BURK|nr:LysR family transcriptional regulator [Achromobacter marplatensis]MDH2050567.1 LysR family transcriptional regulator [Achromobacter marplatensis]